MILFEDFANKVVTITGECSEYSNAHVSSYMCIDENGQLITSNFSWIIIFCDGYATEML